MKILLSCLLILMLFTDSSLATYDTFRRQHIRQSMGTGDCTNVMRTINQGRGRCKDRNTFIIFNEDRVIGICKRSWNGQMRWSRKAFPLVRCDLDQISNYTDCIYAGRRLDGNVQVRCWDSLPVHYNNDRPARFRMSGFVRRQ